MRSSKSILDKIFFLSQANFLEIYCEQFKSFLKSLFLFSKKLHVN
jgi:hypothetical protein